MGILPATEFVILSTTNRLKGYTPGKLIFGRDIILLIGYIMWTWNSYFSKIRCKTVKKINSKI